MMMPKYEVRKNWDVAYHRISLSICQWNVR